MKIKTNKGVMMDTSAISDTSTVIKKLKIYYEKKLPIHFSVIGSKTFRNGRITQFDEDGGFFIIEEFRDGEELFMFTEIYADSISIYKQPTYGGAEDVKGV